MSRARPAVRRANPNFAHSLLRDGLKGARIGILRQAYEGGTPDPEILGVFVKAVDDLKAAGANIVDGASVEQVLARSSILNQSISHNARA